MEFFCFPQKKNKILFLFEKPQKKFFFKKKTKNPRVFLNPGVSASPKVLICRKFGKEVSTFFNNTNEIIFLFS